MSTVTPDTDDFSTRRPAVARFLLTWLVLQVLLIAMQLVPINILGFWLDKGLAEDIADSIYTPAIIVVNVLFGWNGKNLWTLTAIAWFYSAVLSAPLALLWCRLRPSRRW